MAVMEVMVVKEVKEAMEEIFSLVLKNRI